MIKRLMLTVAAILALHATAAYAGGFRGYEWGTEKGRIKKEVSEKMTESSGGETLGYQGELAGIKVLIVFVFDGSKLANGVYTSMAEHADKNGYLADYEQLKGLLVEKYGPAAADECTWLDNRYQNDRQNWGEALSLGQYKCQARWTTDDSEISTMLMGDSGKIKHRVLYKSRLPVNREREDLKKKTLEQL